MLIERDLDYQFDNREYHWNRRFWGCQHQNPLCCLFFVDMDGGWHYWRRNEYWVCWCSKRLFLLIAWMFDAMPLTVGNQRNDNPKDSRERQWQMAKGWISLLDIYNSMETDSLVVEFPEKKGWKHRERNTDSNSCDLCGVHVLLSVWRFSVQRTLALSTSGLYIT